MKNKIIIALIIIISASLFIVIGYTLYAFAAFNVDEVEYTELYSLEIPNSDCKIVAFDIGGGATIGNAIQIRKVCGAESEVLKIIEKYNDVQKMEFSEKNVKVIVSFKNNNERSDTISIAINK